MNNLVIILITLLMSAFFSGMEIAFVASNKLRIELDKKQGMFSSRFITIFASNPAQYITTMLLGNNIALVIYGLYMAKILEPLIARFMGSEIGILAIQTILATLLILLTAEFLPKTIVRIDPNFTLNVFAIPVFIIYVAFFPVTYAIVGLVNSILKNFFKEQSNKTDKENVFSKIDLYHLVTESREEIQENTNTSDELKLFKNALEFTGIRVRDCMIPRTEMVALEINTGIMELRQRFIETGFSKILIYEDNFDNITGYVTSKELFRNPKKIEGLLIPVSYVPETMPANKLLHKLMQEHKSMSVVVDEFGGISGLITVEDIIEEIFGEIEDEHDSTELIEKQIGDHEFIFSGRLEIEDINEKYKLNIPESEEYDTLAGYIFYHYESIPKMHERIVIMPFEFKILKVSKTRIEIVQLKILNT